MSDEEDAQTAALQEYFDSNRPAGYGASFRAGWDAGCDWLRAQAQPSTNEVRAAAERHSLCNYDHRASIATVHAVGQPHCQRDGDPWPCDIQTVARYALEAGQEVARLTEALARAHNEGPHAKECSGRIGDVFHTVDPDLCNCWRSSVRAALATPGEPA